MADIELNRDMCKRHLAVLEQANNAWFNVWNVEVEDYLKLVEAIKFFNDIKLSTREKLIKEGKL